MASVRSLIHTVCTTFATLSPLLTGTYTAPALKVRLVMSGIVVFNSVREALSAGYQIYGRTEDGYLARMRTSQGWALALIIMAK